MYFTVGEEEPAWAVEDRLQSKGGEDPSPLVEVKVSEEYRRDLGDEEPRRRIKSSSRKQLCTVYVTAAILATAGICSLIIAFNFDSLRDSSPEGLPTSATTIFTVSQREGATEPTTRSAEILETGYWWNKTDVNIPKSYHFIANVKNELIKVYDDLRGKGNFTFLRHYFDVQHSRLSKVKSAGAFVVFLDDLGSTRIDVLLVKLQKVTRYPFGQEDVREIFSITKDLKDWYDYLHNLEGYLLSYEIQVNRSRQRKEVTADGFSSYILYTQTRFHGRSEIKHFQFGEWKLKEINSLLARYLGETKIFFTSSAVVYRNKVLLLSEITDRCSSTEPKSVYVLATKILYLDRDLNLESSGAPCNLIIISPNWKFNQVAKISLDGKDGPSHEKATAHDGENGRPGIAGGDGGSFYGIGNASSDLLPVSTSGGKGSDGQNGADGRNGTQGGGLPPVDRDPQCFKEINRVNNSAGEVIVRYFVYSDEACGEDGKDGGAAGKGGKGGTSVLFNVERGIGTFENGRNGFPGAPGVGGKGGLPSDKACFHYSQTINGKWMKLSKVVCENVKLPSRKPGKSNSTQMQFYPDVSERRGKDDFNDALLLYRIFAMSEISKESDEDLIRFMNLLDNTVHIDPLLNPLVLMEEFKQLRQYHHIGFYQSFIKRLSRLQANLAQDNPNAKLLTFLHNITRTESMDIKYGHGCHLIIDLEAYLETVLRNIKTADEPIKLNVDHTKTAVKPIYINKLGNISSEIQKSSIKNYFENVLKRIKNDGEAEKLDNLATYLQVRILRLSVFLGESLIPTIKLILDGRRIELNMYVYQRSLSMISHDYNAGIDQELSNNSVLFYEKKSALQLNKATFSLSEWKLFDRILNAVKPKTPVLDDGGPNLFSNSSDLFFLEVASRKLRFLEGEFNRALHHLHDHLDYFRSHVAFSTNAIKTMRRFRQLDETERGLLTELACQMEHLDTVWLFIESAFQQEQWSGPIGYMKKLDGSLLASDSLAGVESLKQHLHQDWILSEYRRALNAFKQRVFPFTCLYSDITANENLTAQEAAANIKKLVTQVENLKSTITSFDKNIHVTMFSSDNSVGQFHVWYNDEIRHVLNELFNGEKVELTADVENVHILSKSVIRFNTVRLEFRSRAADLDTQVKEILKNFAVEMTHSGYSYYYYRGKTYIIPSSEVTLYYSFEMDSNNEPVDSNYVYRKIKKGDILLSPYTTWSIKLKYHNAAGDLEALRLLADKIDVYLVGTGTYIAENEDDEHWKDVEKFYEPLAGPSPINSWDSHEDFQKLIDN